MEIIDDLNEEFWTRGDPAETAGFQPYHLVKCDKLDPPGNFSYGVFNEQGMLKVLQLHFGAGRRDPLTGMCNILLQLSEDETEITGVIIEDCDCVLLKSTLKEKEPEPQAESETEPVENGEATNEDNADTQENGKTTTEEETEDDNDNKIGNMVIHEREQETKIIDNNDNVHREEITENT